MKNNNSGNQEAKAEKEVDRELKSSEQEDSKTRTHGEILKEQILEGCETYDRSSSSILLSSFTAGLEIAFSFLLIASAHSFFIEFLPEDVVYKLTALVYPIGFILVVLGQSILFTEQTSLLTLPVLSKKRSVISLFRIWGLVILGNITGGILMALTLIWIGPQLEIFSLESVREIGEHVINDEIYTIFVSAILAGWLMGLLSWLVTSSRDSIGEILVIFIITAIMGFCELHHSIIGNIEMFAGMMVSPNIDFFIYLKTLITVLIGNAIGAVVFVALLKYRAFVFNFRQA